MMAFYKRDGTECDAATWIKELKAADRIVCESTITVNGADLHLVGTYVGISHGTDANGKPMIYHLAIEGDPVKHPDYHKKLYKYATAGELQAKYAVIIP